MQIWARFDACLLFVRNGQDQFLVVTPFTLLKLACAKLLVLTGSWMAEPKTFLVLVRDLGWNAVYNMEPSFPIGRGRVGI